MAQDCKGETSCLGFNTFQIYDHTMCTHTYDIPFSGLKDIMLVNVTNIYVI